MDRTAPMPAQACSLAASDPSPPPSESRPDVNTCPLAAKALLHWACPCSSFFGCFSSYGLPNLCNMRPGVFPKMTGMTRQLGGTLTTGEKGWIRGHHEATKSTRIRGANNGFPKEQVEKYPNTCRAQTRKMEQVLAFGVGLSDPIPFSGIAVEMLAHHYKDC